MLYRIVLDGRVSGSGQAPGARRPHLVGMKPKHRPIEALPDSFVGTGAMGIDTRKKKFSYFCIANQFVAAKRVKGLWHDDLWQGRGVG